MTKTKKTTKADQEPKETTYTIYCARSTWDHFTKMTKYGAILITGIVLLAVTVLTS